MKPLIIKAPAKINLGLSILGKFPSGYHEVKTIYCQVDLFDELTFQKLGNSKIEINCNNPSLPVNEKNLVYQAILKARSLLKAGSSDSGIKIFIKKNIPIGSGLGGGSIDAAMTLKALNKLWKLNLTLVQLIKLAKNIGADVAYHLIGGMQLEYQGGGKAGKFLKLPKLPMCYIVLCFPNIYINSTKAYRQVDYEKINKNNLLPLVQSIKLKNLKQIGQSLHNDFENWTLIKHPVIKQVKETMLKYGTLGSLMSGKGSSVYGIFEDLDKAKLVTQLLKKDFRQTFLVKPI